MINHLTSSFVTVGSTSPEYVQDSSSESLAFQLQVEVASKLSWLACAPASSTEVYNWVSYGMAVEAQLRRHEAPAVRPGRPDKIVGAVWAPTAGRFVGIGEHVNLGHSGHGQIVAIATDLRNISVDEIPT